jgi:DNA modification methylase
MAKDWRVVNEDCVAYMDAAVKPESVDLAFADPPFNIGFKYDAYDDKRATGEYVGWCLQWMNRVHRSLKPNGTFWLAIGDEYAAELKVTAKALGFHPRSWIIWYYSFGVNCKNNYSRSHTHLLYFVKDPKNFTFRADDPNNRVNSKRQIIYGDLRANPFGRLPDNTWTFFDSCWTFPRIAGTHTQRNDSGHGCQMPEQLLARIINTCSNEGDLVLDPFGGTGTTIAVAKKLGRSGITCELSEKHCVGIDERLAAISNDGAPIDGDGELIPVKQEHIKGQPDKIRPAL